MILYRTYAKKRIVVISTCIIILSMFIFLIIPTCYAGITNWLTDAISTLITELCHSEMSQRVVEILCDSELWSTSSTDGNTLATFIQTMITAMKSVAAGLLMVKITIEVIHEFSDGKVGLDPFLRLFIRMALTLTLILNMDTIICAIMKFMYDPATETGFLSDIANLFNLEGELEEVEKALSEALAGDVGGGLVILSFPVLLIELALVKALGLIVSGILLIIVSIAAYTLVIEFTIRRIFMPIALVFLMQEGVRGPGMRYIKRMVGLFIRMLIMIISFGLADIMLLEVLKGLPEDMTSFLNLGWDVLKYSTVFTIAASSFSRRGAGLADEILGV